MRAHQAGDLRSVIGGIVEELRKVGEGAGHSSTGGGKIAVLLRPTPGYRIRRMVRQRGDIFIRRHDAFIRVDQEAAVIGKQEPVRRTGRHIALIPVGIAPALVAQVGATDLPVIRTMEESRDLVVLLPGFRWRQFVAMAVGKSRLLRFVVEQIGAMVPGLEIAVEANAVYRTAIAVQQRYSLLTADIAALGIVPFRTVRSDEVVEIDDATCFRQIAQPVPLHGIDVELARLGRDILHDLGEFLAVGHADDIKLDPCLLLPKFLDRGRTGRKWLGDLSDGAIRQDPARCDQALCRRRAVPWRPRSPGLPAYRDRIDSARPRRNRLVRQSCLPPGPIAPAPGPDATPKARPMRWRSPLHLSTAHGVKSRRSSSYPPNRQPFESGCCPWADCRPTP